MWNLSHIWSIKSYMDTDSLKTTVQALCILHVDYSNTLFYGLPTKDINCLQFVQNSCAKVVLGKNQIWQFHNMLETTPVVACQILN